MKESDVERWTLMQCCGKFLDLHPELIHPSQVEGRCQEVPAIFSDFLIEHGLKGGQVVELVFPHDQYLCPESYPSEWRTNHYVLRVEGKGYDVGIDWTIAQFDATSTVPLIFSFSV